MSSTKSFSLGAILSVYTQRRITTMDDVYEVMGFLFNDPSISTIGIALMADRAKRVLDGQLAFLTSDEFEGDEMDLVVRLSQGDPKTACDQWLRDMELKYGATHTLHSLS